MKSTHDAEWIYIFKKTYEDLQIFNNGNSSSKFSFQTKNHWLIVCLVASRDHIGINYEDICSSIGRSTASRSTIATILDNGIEKGVFIKRKHDTDKRVQLYALSKESINFLKEWIDTKLKIFNPSAKKIKEIDT